MLFKYAVLPFCLSINISVTAVKCVSWYLLQHVVSFQTFAFDHCFWSMDPNEDKFADQEHVFKCLGVELLDNAFDGYNACIFAYGQTGRII